jgi:hypothetical protein
MREDQDSQHPAVEAVEEQHHGLSRQTSHNAPSISQIQQIQSEKALDTFNRVSSLENNRTALYLTPSHISTHDATVIHHQDPHYEAGDEIYERFSHVQKVIMVTILSFTSFLLQVRKSSRLTTPPEQSSASAMLYTCSSWALAHYYTAPSAPLMDESGL